MIIYGGMELNENLSQSVEYTKTLGKNSGNLLILIIINLIPIVNFITLGYAWEVIKRTPESSELPPLKGYVDLWIKGLKMVVASIIILIIPIIVLMASGAIFMISVFGIMGGSDVMGMAAIGAMIGIVIGIILAFIFGIFLQMALVHMVRNNSIGKAFAFGEVMNKISTIGISKYLLWFIIIFVLWVILTAIGTIPYGIGYIIAQIIGVFFVVFRARSATLIYQEGDAI